MLAALKKEVCASVDRLARELLDVSHEIHAHPELAFEEVRAARLLTETARRRGLDARQNVYGLETAIEARIGDAGPTVALLSEYDALPGIGHACGHNIIATTALGAAGRFYVRAATAAELTALKIRVEGCLRAGADATGARLELVWGAVDYLDLDTSWPLAKRYQANAEQLGRAFFPYDKIPPGVQGSTDMGNVSQRVPSIHPMIACS